MENSGNCEGSYTCLSDGRIYRYTASYRGADQVNWSASVSWGETAALSRTGSICHNILSGHSLQELVRAHVLASIQNALDEKIV